MTAGRELVIAAQNDFGTLYVPTGEDAERAARMLHVAPAMQEAGDAFLTWFKEYSGRQCIAELESNCPEYRAFVAALESAQVKA